MSQFKDSGGISQLAGFTHFAGDIYLQFSVVWLEELKNLGGMLQFQSWQRW
jgi:hypothetical protein